MPGENAPMGTVCGGLAFPPTVTITVAEVCPANSWGISTFSWPGKAAKRGAGIPLKVTLAPPSVVSNFPLLPKDDDALLDPSSKFDPKMAAMVPGASGLLPGAKLAPLTTEFAGIV